MSQSKVKLERGDVMELLEWAATPPEKQTDEWRRRFGVNRIPWLHCVAEQLARHWLAVQERNSVLQPWVEELPHMMQGTLLAAVRGPDGLPKHHPAKPVLRWFRRSILFSAYMGGTALNDPWADDNGKGGSFTGPWEPQDTFASITAAFIDSLDECNLHFVMHLVHASRIIAAYHPVFAVRACWLEFYAEIVHALHLEPESYSSFVARLGDQP